MLFFIVKWTEKTRGHRHFENFDQVVWTSISSWWGSEPVRGTERNRNITTCHLGYPVLIGIPSCTCIWHASLDVCNYENFFFRVTGGKAPHLNLPFYINVVAQNSSQDTSACLEYYSFVQAEGATAESTDTNRNNKAPTQTERQQTTHKLRHRSPKPWPEAEDRL